MHPDLNLAIQHHELGRLNEAARVYEWILGQPPEDPFFASVRLSRASTGGGTETRSISFAGLKNQSFPPPGPPGFDSTIHRRTGCRCLVSGKRWHQTDPPAPSQNRASAKTRRHYAANATLATGEKMFFGVF